MQSFSCVILCNQYDSKENWTTFPSFFVLTAFKALNSYVIKSKCVNDCIKSLSLRRPMNVQYADHPWRKLRHVTTSWLLRLLWSIKLMIGHLMKLQPDALQSRTLRLRKWTQTLLSLYRASIRLLVGVIADHSMIGRMSERMGYPRNDLCSSCLDEEEESVQHFFFFLRWVSFV